MKFTGEGEALSSPGVKKGGMKDQVTLELGPKVRIFF